MLIVEGDSSSVPPFKFSEGRCGTMIKTDLDKLDEEKRQLIACFVV